MAELAFDAIQTKFRQALHECQRLYRSAARQYIDSQAALAEDSAESFPQLMEDLHKGLLIKIYGSISQADRRWTAEEAKLAEILFEHVWGQQLSGDRLREAALHVFDQSNRLRWYSLVRPFEHLTPLRDRVDELETIITRLANLVSKCDGVVTDSEAALLRTIEEEIHSHLRPLSFADQDTEEPADQAASRTVQQIEAETPHLDVSAGRKAQRA